MPPRAVPLLVPELGMGQRALATALWLVDRGASVTRGDRLVEIVAGPALVDLSAPVDGILTEKRVGEDQPVVTGQILGILETEDDQPAGGG